MGIRIKDGTKARTYRAPMTASEAYLANTAYTKTAGFMTKSAATVAPDGISLGQGHALSANYTEYDFARVDPGTVFEIDVEDSAGDNFFEAPSANGTSTTIVDTTNRTEAGAALVGGEIAIHVKGPEGELYQRRIITGNTSSDGTVTFAPALLDQNGAALATSTSMRYSLVAFGQGDKALRLNSDIDALDAQPTMTGGKVMIASPVNFSSAQHGKVTVDITFDA